MAGRRKKYQNLFGTSVYNTIKHFQNILGLTERQTIKRLHTHKKLPLRSLDDYDRISTEQSKSIDKFREIMGKNNRTQCLLLFALAGSANGLEKAASIFWVFFHQRANFYVSALMQDTYESEWDKVMQTRYKKYGQSDYISPSTLKCEFDREKKELKSQVLDAVRHVWENNSCRSEYNRKLNRKNCNCDPTKGESCNGIIPLKQMLFLYYWYDSRFSTQEEIFKFLNDRFENVPESEPEIKKFIEQFLADEGERLLELSNEFVNRTVYVDQSLENNPLKI